VLLTVDEIGGAGLPDPLGRVPIKARDRQAGSSRDRSEQKRSERQAIGELQSRGHVFSGE